MAASSLWVTADPWQSASRKGAADAQALNHIQNQPDRISFYLAKDTSLLKAVMWSPNGSLLYPGPHAYVPTRFDLSPEEISELTRLTSKPLAGNWSPYDRDGHERLYCQTSPRMCLIYAHAELQNGFQTALHGWTKGVTWALTLLGSLSLLVAWRHRAAQPSDDQLVLLPDQHSARHGTLQVALTPRDFRLLEFLQEKHGAVVTKDELYDAGWGRDFMPNSRALDQHIINLRKKLDPDKSRSPVIETVRGVGYKLVK
ncbi:winged helix-turn-helix domain-containing protein [Tateyamaria sp. ANG-S1]|uniref:winged helix-turn-helix domain-containing protein n=1 Tax=Tateyamaria sp. ANG-S1 TaxID=1577905 RepID=UPI00068BF2A6|nr:winged helix-turn-helix domain-containing protein [Tateyamaria sp. ANG-S1]